MEGELVSDEHPTNNIRVIDMKISHVYEGDLKVGQTISIDQSYFFHVSPTAWSERMLEKGDRLFFFNDHAQITAANPEIYFGESSYMYFVTGDKVVQFFPNRNPGPYIAALEGAETNADVPVITAFREQVEESIPRVNKWKPFLDKEPTTNDIPIFLEILSERQHRFGKGADLISEKVRERLHELHMPDTSQKAIQ